jgi:hypothetical protein
VGWELYRLTSPSGGTYIGLTKTGMRARWLAHQKVARKGKVHPLYCAIRKYGPESFRVDLMDVADTLEQANAAEIALIAELQPRYNVHPGGGDTGGAVSRMFWDRIRQDPEAFAAYRARLSAACKGRAVHPAQLSGAARWRGENPRGVWQTAWRASRLALRAAGVMEKRDPRFSRWGGRLWIKSEKLALARSSIKKSLRTADQWARMSPEEKTERKAQISAGAKTRAATWSAEEKSERTAKARAAIVHSPEVKQARRDGIARYWAELKADPVRWAEVQQAKREKAQAAALRAGKSLRSTS